MSVLLKLGSSGPNVTNLQKMLNHLRMSQVPLRLDGIFGPKTNAAIIQFQTQSLLKPDGIVGPLTSKKLLSYVFSDIYKPSGVNFK
jgi:peptidoglycan hydrolase-like protein with peptidoglycan-binding domain